MPQRRSSLSLLCFHTLPRSARGTNCFSRLPAGRLADKPFVLTTIRIARRVPSSVVPPLCLGVSVANPFFSCDCGLFVISKKVICLGISHFRTLLQKHRGWGVSIHDQTGSRSRPPWSSQFKRRSASGASRRATSGRGLPVPEPLPTRGSLMLVFGLQDAARAAQVLGVAHVLSLCLRFECFPCGRRTSRRAFSREGHLMPGAAAQKGTTNP
jgi:hypothetical protein